MSSAEQTTAPSDNDLGGIVVELEPGLQSKDLETRQRAALLAFGRRAGANPDKSILVTDAATLLATTFQSDFSSVGEVVANGTTLMLKVAKTTETGKPLDWVVHKMSLSAADSMAGTALETAQPVVADNLPLQKQFADLSLRKLGIISGLTVPLHLDSKPFGTLGVYTTSKYGFTKKDICFAETIAHLLTNSIARAHSEEQLQNHRRLASTILQNVDSLVIEIDVEFKLIALNRACRSVTGFALNEIAGKAFSSVFVVPEELDLVQGILRSSVADKSPCEFESFLLTKDGNRRNIDWSLSVMCQDEGTIRSIVLTGTDRTELIETEVRLEKVETLARRSVTRLKELRQELAEQTLTSTRPTPTGGETPDTTPDDASRTAPPSTTRGEAPSTPPSKHPGEVASDATRTEAPAETGALPKPGMVRWPNGSVGSEARTSVRRAFNYKQLIAPMYGGVMPARKEFFQVTCENISAGGFAFFLNYEPDFEYLVVALGQDPMLTFFSARVIRVMEKEHDGKGPYLIGCRFSGRVHP
ncbi:MAG: PAS domain S-box protein [Thermoguttaceae bacterium]